MPALSYGCPADVWVEALLRCFAVPERSDVRGARDSVAVLPRLSCFSDSTWWLVLCCSLGLSLLDFDRDLLYGLRACLLARPHLGFTVSACGRILAFDDGCLTALATVNFGATQPSCALDYCMVVRLFEFSWCWGSWTFACPTCACEFSDGFILPLCGPTLCDLWPVSTSLRKRLRKSRHIHNYP